MRIFNDIFHLLESHTYTHTAAAKACAKGFAKFHFLSHEWYNIHFPSLCVCVCVCVCVACISEVARQNCVVDEAKQQKECEMPVADWAGFSRRRKFWDSFISFFFDLPRRCYDYFSQDKNPLDMNRFANDTFPHLLTRPCVWARIFHSGGDYSIMKAASEGNSQINQL